MKPKIECKNFDPPENLVIFMKEAIGEILRVSPYDSHLEAYINKELHDYLMTISIHYPEGQFTTTTRDGDLKTVITRTTANIFTQVRTWWKSRFQENDSSKTDWAGDFAKTDAGQVLHNVLNPLKERYLKGNAKEEDIEIYKSPLRVLVVDDDIESVVPLELCLDKLGCEIFVVNNGFEAIHEMVSGNRNYDVVILDWQMPEMTGGQALLNAQKVITYNPKVNSHWTRKQLPVITFSSRSRDEIEVPTCEDFRHVEHWEKPASYLHLLNMATETFARLRSETDGKIKGPEKGRLLA